MQPSSKVVVDLEKKFWKALVEEDADTAISMLDEPALMVSPMGTMKFSHADYRRMAEEGTMIVKSYELSDIDVVFPKEDTAVLTYRVKQTLVDRDQSNEIEQEMADSSVWSRKDGKWLCVMHTETPIGEEMH